MNEEIIDWLLKGKPWIAYRTYRDILNYDEKHEKVRFIKNSIIKSPEIQKIFLKQARGGWWGEKKRLYSYSGNRTLERLQVLGDFGFTSDLPQIARGCQFVISFQLPSGGFPFTENDTHAMDCASGLALKTLMKVSFSGTDKLRRGYDWLLSRQRLDGGWIHSMSCQVGMRREKEPSCPWASLCVLGAIAEVPNLQESDIAKNGIDFLLDCWEKKGRTRSFGIGTKFKKLKYPFTFYELLHLADVLSKFSFIKKDPRMVSLVKFVLSRQGENGHFWPEAIHKAWSDFDFGQKKNPSRWLTFLVKRIEKRVMGASHRSVSN